MKDKDVRKRRLNPTYRKLITNCLSKQSTYFRVELSRDELEIFVDKLAPWSDYQIIAAFDRCLSECMFLPKVKEVLERMPEETRGPTRTCPRCEPDGWRLIISPTAGPPYLVAVRCDHNSGASEPNLLDLVRPFARKICREQFQRDYDSLDETDPGENKIIFMCCFLGNRERYRKMGIDMTRWDAPVRSKEDPTTKAPRWPHLIGKGVLYGKGREPGEEE